MKNKSKITKELVITALKKVIDPELHIDIVSLGLIYEVVIREKQVAEGAREHIHVLMTLTTPGCPLIGVFDKMVKDAVLEIEEIESEQDVTVELTFDPPWIPEMMDEVARAELGL
ncbi:MAG: iron-sulfur cluster assembly protein [Microgenomates group bacterium]